MECPKCESTWVRLTQTLKIVNNIRNYKCVHCGELFKTEEVHSSRLDFEREALAKYTTAVREIETLKKKLQEISSICNPN